jgi:acyl-CoA synthetase (AMP-forming)/AMP-acid ligase II
MIFRSPWPPLQDTDASLIDVVLGAARRHGDKPALIEGESGRSISYRELADGVERVGAGLALAGLRPGQALAVALPNSIEFALAWFGALRAGAWVVPINPIYTAAEIRHQVHDSGARFLVTLPERSGELAGAAENVFDTGSRWDELLQCDMPVPPLHVSADDLAVLPYSSGTTGTPKGVVLTHANILANVQQFITTFAVRAEDVLVNVFPLYHVAGLNGVLNSHLAAGATIVLTRRFDLPRWLTLIERYRGTCILIPPPVVVGIAKSDSWDRHRLESVMKAACGAAPLGADMQKAFEDRTGLVLQQIWGMTEASAVVSVDAADRKDRKPGLVRVSGAFYGSARRGRCNLRRLRRRGGGRNLAAGTQRHEGLLASTRSLRGHAAERGMDAYRRRRLF